MLAVVYINNKGYHKLIYFKELNEEMKKFIKENKIKEIQRVE